MRLFSILIIILACIGCNPSRKDKLLEEALLIIENNSVNKNIINWKEYKEKVYLKAEKIKSVNDRYLVISYALRLLNDHHSFFIRPFVKNEKLNPFHANKLCDWRTIEHTIGYIQIPTCLGSDVYLLEYSSTIRKAISDLDKRPIEGWIIDLRRNVGGYLPAMLIGLGPFINEGIILYSSFPDGRFMPWIYKSGAIYKGQNEEMKESLAYNLIHKDKKIAVLINDTTASAGEFLAVYFKEDKRARLFGCKTYGNSTDNKAFCLSDSSWIVLTVANVADVNKKVYGGSIVPDETSPYCYTNELINVAKDWIRRN